VIRLLIAVVWWAMFIPLAGLVGIPWTFVSGKIDFLYRIATWGAFRGVLLAGVKVETEGLDRLDPASNYIFMANHVSNIDPPILVPLIPRRTSVLVKRELFGIPILGYAMRLGDLVAVDRANREAAVDSVRRAVEVLKRGLNMVIFPEGTRSRDGRLLPFKKGPFYLAIDSGVSVVPVSMVNTFQIWPKGHFYIKPLTARVVFHRPLNPRDFATRDDLMNAVRNKIASELPT
jgi:1-acyl-sn-glycerol-3-phosphate acyltransferase